MTTEEAITVLNNPINYMGNGIDGELINAIEIAIFALRAQQEREANPGNISDGYHTFDELYEQRAVLFSALCRLFSGIAWKSKLHADGTMFDGHFIVGIETPAGQYTYHYGFGKWDWFPVKELVNAPEWDGHTDKDARRLWTLSTRQERENPQPLTLEELKERVGKPVWMVVKYRNAVMTKKSKRYGWKGWVIVSGFNAEGLIYEGLQSGWMNLDGYGEYSFAYDYEPKEKS